MTHRDARVFGHARAGRPCHLVGIDPRFTICSLYVSVHNAPFLSFPQSGKPMWVLDGIQELCNRNARSRRPYRGPLRALRDTPHAPTPVRLPCDFLGPGSAPCPRHHCLAHAVAEVPGAFARALPVYLPVYLVPAVLVHRTKLFNLSHAKSVLSKALLGAVRSAAFMGALFGLAWAGGCAGWRVAGISGPGEWRSILSRCVATPGSLAPDTSCHLHAVLYLCCHPLLCCLCCYPPPPPPPPPHPVASLACPQASPGPRGSPACPFCSRSHRDAWS